MKKNKLKIYFVTFSIARKFLNFPVIHFHLKISPRLYISIFKVRRKKKYMGLKINNSTRHESLALIYVRLFLRASIFILFNVNNIFCVFHEKPYQCPHARLLSCRFKRCFFLTHKPFSVGAVMLQDSLYLIIFFFNRFVMFSMLNIVHSHSNLFTHQILHTHPSY